MKTKRSFPFLLFFFFFSPLALFAKDYSFDEEFPQSYLESGWNIQLFEDSEIIFTETNVEFERVSEILSGYEEDGVILEINFFLRESRYPDLGLYLQGIGGYFEVFLNGVKIQGEDFPKNHSFGRVDFPYSLLQEGQSNTLLLKIEAAYREGVLLGAEAPLFSSSSQIQRLHYKKLLKSNIVAFFCALLSSYNLFFFLFVRKRKDFLFLGLSAFSFAVFVFLGEWSVPVFQLPLLAKERINTVSVSFSMIFLGLFFLAFFKDLLLSKRKFRIYFTLIIISVAAKTISLIWVLFLKSPEAIYHFQNLFSLPSNFFSFFTLFFLLLHASFIREKSAVTLLSVTLAFPFAVFYNYFINSGAIRVSTFSADLFPLYLLLLESVLLIRFLVTMNHIVRFYRELRTNDLLKSRFLDSIEHEMKMPMKSLLGNLTLLLDEKETKLFPALIRQVETDNEAILKMVDKILLVAKIEKEELSLNRQAFNLQDVISEVIDEYEEEAKDLGLYVSLEFFQRVQVVLDKGRVKKIFSEILENAVRFNREGGNISIYMENNADPKSVSFCVEDCGIGISADEILKVTQMFYTGLLGYLNVSPEQHRTGLGLYIAQSLVDRMGGSLFIESVIGEGTRVHLTLPRS